MPGSLAELKVRTLELETGLVAMMASTVGSTASRAVTLVSWEESMARLQDRPRAQLTAIPNREQVVVAIDHSSPFSSYLEADHVRDIREKVLSLATIKNLIRLHCICPLFISGHVAAC